nr:hypothetical protein [Tanacetum cinerariifolium]
MLYGVNAIAFIVVVTIAIYFRGFNSNHLLSRLVEILSFPPILQSSQAQLALLQRLISIPVDEYVFNDHWALNRPNNMGDDGSDEQLNSIIYVDCMAQAFDGYCRH